MFKSLLKDPYSLQIFAICKFLLQISNEVLKILNFTISETFKKFLKVFEKAMVFKNKQTKKHVFHYQKQ